MGFDQEAFTFFFRWGKKREQKRLAHKKIERHAVSLEEIRDSLSLFASAIFALPMELRSTEELPYRSGFKLFLPEFLGIANSLEMNSLAYRILILHQFALSKLSKPLQETLTEEQELQRLEGLKSQGMKLLQEMFPLYDRLLEKLLQSLIPNEAKEKPLMGFDTRALWGRLPRTMTVIDASLQQPELREAFPDGTERKSRSRGQAKKIEIDENKENIGDQVFHNFEKLETAEEYMGMQATPDGEDDLADHAEALDDLNLEDVIRSSTAAKSLYKTELDVGFEMADLKEEGQAAIAEQVFYYDEWDEKKRNYKKDWCRLVHTKVSLKDQKKIRARSLLEVLDTRRVEIDKLRRRLLQLASEHQVAKRLFYGPEIDIDNVVRNQAFRQAGVNGDQRYYQESKKRRRDLACLLLVDTSLSSDSWVQNRRVLDVSLEALLCFGEATASLDDPVMVAGFHSNTRNDCRFIEWKSFEEPWIHFRENADTIDAAGYTRIGPALRHATELLLKRKERHKLLLMFTDGRPTDFDRYEGNYGLSDVRQAVREAERAGVLSFAMALDPSAKQFLPTLFGAGNFQILHDVESLPESLTKLYAKMAKRH